MSALIKGILGERISVKVGTDKKKMTRKEIMARQIVNEAGKGNFRALKTLLSLTMDRMVEEQEEAHKRARQQEQAALEWEELRKRLNRKVAEKEREAEQRFQAAVDEEVKSYAIDSIKGTDATASTSLGAGSANNNAVYYHDLKGESQAHGKEAKAGGHL
jgi:hypothetical protein